jgi:hypothetical protein
MREKRQLSDKELRNNEELIEANDKKTTINRLLYLMGFKTKYVGVAELSIESDVLSSDYNHCSEKVSISAIKNPNVPIEYLEKFILLESQRSDPNHKLIKAAKETMSKRQS